MKELPEVLYHAAPQCVYDSIEEEGLKSNFSEVYATGSLAEALSFMYFRILDHPHPKWDADGKLSFDITEHDEIHIWLIDTSVTGKKSWNNGTDHASSFFGGASSYVHTGDISPDALMGCEIVTREEIEAALEEKRASRAEK